MGYEFDSSSRFDESKESSRIINHQQKIAELEKQVADLTLSLHDLQEKLNQERKEKSELIQSNQGKLSEMMSKLDELKSSRKVVAKDVELQAETESKGIDDSKIRELEDSMHREREGYLNLIKKYENLEKMLQESELEKRKYAEEIEVLSQRIEIKQTRESEEMANENLISKLNARISALKFKEQKLYEENAKLENLYNELRA